MNSNMKHKERILRLKNDGMIYEERKERSDMLKRSVQLVFMIHVTAKRKMEGNGEPGGEF